MSRWSHNILLIFSMISLNHNKLLIMFYWVPMITMGELFKFFISYGKWWVRNFFCGKFIFHVVFQRKKKMKCSTILVVACAFRSCWRAKLGGSRGADSLTLRVGSTVSGRLVGLVEAWWFGFIFGAGRGGGEQGRMLGVGLVGVR